MMIKDTQHARRPVRKIALVEPASSGASFFSGIRSPRQGVVIMGTILAQRGYEVGIHSEVVSPLDFSQIASADLVGISNLTPTVPRAYAIADALRQAGITVVTGGYHDTFLPDQALEHADFVVRGEGEDTIVELLEALDNGADFCNIAGLSFQADGQKVHNLDRPLEADLDRFPIPDFSLVRGVKRNGVVSLITRRGCPYDCSFCCATAFNGRAVREHSVDRVLAEIEKQMYWIGKKGILFFLDDIFNLKPTRMKKILRGMIENRLTPLWVGQVRHEASRDPELLELMRQSNCSRVFVGFESVNPRTLERFGKNQTVESISRAIGAFHRARIKIHGMFVLGCDEDTLETFEQTLDFCRAHDLDSMQVNSLTPLPGSRDFSVMNQTPEKLVGAPWNFYDCYHVVHVPKQIPPADLQLAGNRTMTKFYSLKAIFQRLIRGDLSEVAVRLHCYRLARRLSREIRPYIRWLKNRTGPPPLPAGSDSSIPNDLACYRRRAPHQSIFSRLRSWLAGHLRLSFTRFLHLPSGWPTWPASKRSPKPAPTDSAQPQNQDSPAESTPSLSP